MTPPSTCQPLTASLVQSAFAPLVGLPCWGAKQVHGSIVKLEFGPVTVPARPSIVSQMRIAANPDAQLTITATPPGGAWDFTLIDAAWKIVADDLMSTDESPQPVIESTLTYLNGQTLSKVKWEDNGQLIVEFLEGGKIQAGPSPFHNLSNAMWWLFQTGIECMVVDGHGCYSVRASGPDKEGAAQ